MRRWHLLGVAIAASLVASPVWALNASGTIEFYGPSGVDREVCEITVYTDEVATLDSVDFDWSASNVQYSGLGPSGGLIDKDGVSTVVLTGSAPSQLFSFDYTGFDRDDYVIYALDLDRVSPTGSLPATADYGGGVATLSFSDGTVLEVVFDGVTDGRVPGTSNLASFVLGTPPPSPYSYPLHQQDPTASPFSVGTAIDSVRGWRFRVNGGYVVVGQLGVFTPRSDTDSVPVRLFDASSGRILAAATTRPGEGWRWVNVSPVKLTNGGEYVVTAYGAAGAWYWFGDSGSVGSGWFPTGTIEYLDGRYANSAGGPDTFPSQSAAQQYGLVDIGWVLSDIIPTAAIGGDTDQVVDPSLGPPGYTAQTLLFDISNPKMISDLRNAVVILKNNDGPPPSAATPWDDLRISLRKEDAEVALNAHPTGAVTGAFDVTFWDEASASIQAAKAGGDALGLYRPDGGVLERFTGRLLSGRWELNFQDTYATNETLLDAWALVVETVPEAPLLVCGGPGAGGDNAATRGIVFEVDQPFQAVRLDMSSSTSGQYVFDAELRRSPGFTGLPEVVAGDVTADLDVAPTSVVLPFGEVPVSGPGPETFTLKIAGISGPGSLYFQVHGGGRAPCPHVMETGSNSVPDPTERGDPAGFAVIALPEPGSAVLLGAGAGLLLALARRRA